MLKLKSNSILPKKSPDEILLFLADDNLLYLKTLEKSISEKFPLLKIQTFQTGESCLQALKLKPDIIILDYYFDSELPYAWNGLEVLKQIKKLSPDTKVIMLSDQDSLETATNCIGNGAYNYLSKNEVAFIRINNVLLNIIESIESSKKGVKSYQVIVAIIILSFLMSFLFH